MKKISTDKAPAAIGPYSQGIVAGIFCLLPGRFRWILRAARSWVRRLRNRQSGQFEMLALS